MIPKINIGNKKKPIEDNPSSLICLKLTKTIRAKMTIDKIVKNKNEPPKEKEVTANTSSSKKETAFP